MSRTVYLVLDWNGPYVDPDHVPKGAGIYMVVAGSKKANGKWNTPSYELLDIGQSGETGARLDTHSRKPCWENKRHSNQTILFKFAAMPSEDYDEIDRRTVECCLRAHTQPPCGTECNEGYYREEFVAITNKGKYIPLKKEYSCGLEKRVLR